jgi:hypothetical protein
VGWHHSPGLWEQDNDSVKSYFEAYLRDNNVSVNDVRSIREAQARGGATFKIQSGTYAGLDQDVKACVLISKRLKTDPEDRRIYEDSLNYKKQISTKKDSIASDSLELYKSFFDEPLPDVDLYCGGNGNTTSNTIGSSSSTFGSSFNVKNSQISAAALQLSEDFRKVSLYKKKNGIFSGNLISVGPLFKLDGGKDQDFILFNESAAENAFGEVIQNETELSFYAK